MVTRGGLRGLDLSVYVWNLGASDQDFQGQILTAATTRNTKNKTPAANFHFPLCVPLAATVKLATPLSTHNVLAQSVPNKSVRLSRAVITPAEYIAPIGPSQDRNAPGLYITARSKKYPIASKNVFPRVLSARLSSNVITPARVSPPTSETRTESITNYVPLLVLITIALCFLALYARRVLPFIGPELFFFTMLVGLIALAFQLREAGLQPKVAILLRSLSKKMTTKNDSTQ